MSQFKRFNASENDNWNTSAVYPSGTLTWDPDNGLRLHDGNTGGGVAIGGGGSLTAVDTNIQIVVSDANQNYYTIRQIIDDNNGNYYASTDLNYEQFSIRTDQQNNGGYEWRFDSNGEFRVPGNINTYDNDIEIRAMNAGNAGNITIKTVSHINNIHYSQIQLNQGGINITTDMDVTSGGRSFEFRDTGVLVLPSGGNIHNSSGNSVIVPQALGTGASPEFAGLYINGSSGYEGGEIRLALAQNTALSGTGVTIDVYQDRIRFFEAGGTARGAYVDLAQASAGVETLLNNRVSGIVNAGTFVIMDNIKATVPTSGDRGLSLATVTGSFSCFIGGNYSLTTNATGGDATALSVTASASASVFNWNFTGAGDISYYIITDTTNSRAYRITLQIGGGYNNNLICIERLV